MPVLKKINEKRWIIIVIALFCLIALIAFLTAPLPLKQPHIQLPKLVKVIPARKVDKSADIIAYGTVQPMREAVLRSEVSGRVIYKSPNIEIGGVVADKELLLRVDPRDYQNIVEQEKAAYQKALFDLKVEAGRQAVAKREWREITSSIETESLNRNLALRKPHLKEKEAALEAAKSRLDKAKLDLLRTNVFSPMEAIVLEETVEEGDLINSQTTLAKLAATDQFRIQVSIPLSQLRWISFPDKNERGDIVRIVQDLGGENRQVREGRISRFLGDLDPSGKMVRFLVVVDDPLNIKIKDRHRKFPLLLGSYVKVIIKGPVLKDVILLPREAVREENRVWVKNSDDKLEIKKVRIAQKNEREVIIDKGLDDGDLVIVSHLQLPIPGMSLKVFEEEDENR